MKILNKTFGHKIILAVTLSIVMCFTGCAKDGYENLGSEREVSSKAEETVEEEQETVLQDVFADGSKTFTGSVLFEYYENESETASKTNTLDLNLQLDQYQNAKLSIGEDINFYLDYNNLRLYLQEPDTSGDLLCAKLFDFYFLGAVKEQFFAATEQAMIENGAYGVRDDNEAIMIEFDSESLTETIYDVADILSDNYDEIYTATKNNSELLASLTNDYGEYYDFSSGIPSSFIEIYVEAISETFGESLYFSEEPTNLNFSIMVENADDKPVIMFLIVMGYDEGSVSIQGELNYEGNECDDIEIPEVTVDTGSQTNSSTDSSSSDTDSQDDSSEIDLEMPTNTSSESDSSATDSVTYEDESSYTEEDPTTDVNLPTSDSSSDVLESEISQNSLAADSSIADSSLADASSAVESSSET